MNSTPTICISCGEPMAPGADRAPSLGNPNQCVPCCTGHQLPAEGSAAYRATDGPTPAAGGEALRVWRDCHGADVRAAGDTLPPATAPAACISRDAGPETTAAGGNPLTSDLYVDTPQNAARYTVHTEAAASEVNPFPAGRWTVPKQSNGGTIHEVIDNSGSGNATAPDEFLARGCEPTVPAAVPASNPAVTHAAGTGPLCIKCGAPIEEPWLATVCCADCRAGFRVPAPMRPDRPWDEESEALTLELRRKGIQSIPADTHQDDHAWRMLL